MWPGEDPIGQELRPNGSREPWYHVVGVTGDVLTRGLDQPPSEIVYYPMVADRGRATLVAADAHDGS